MISSKSILIFLIAILLFHIIATVDYWYWTYLWFDIPMHFLGGFWVALFWFNQKRRLTQMGTQINADNKGIGENLRDDLRESALPMIIGCLSFVALVGVLWEFYEFLNDFFLSSKNYTQILQQGAADTISDLFFDLLGGAAFITIFYFFLKKNNSNQ